MTTTTGIKLTTIAIAAITPLFILIGVALADGSNSVRITVGNETVSNVEINDVIHKGEIGATGADGDKVPAQICDIPLMSITAGERPPTRRRPPTPNPTKPTWPRMIRR